jgi:molybdate transport system substrate-binding protein
MGRTLVGLLVVSLLVVGLIASGCAKTTDESASGGPTVGTGRHAGAENAAAPGAEGSPATGAKGANGETRLLLLGPCGMTAPMAAIIKQFEATHAGIKIDLTTDNSVIIAKRVVEKGAACDLFISPGSRQLGILEQKGIADMSTVKPFTAFEVVCIVPKANPAGIKKPEDLLKAKVISMPSPELDSTGYAGREALQKLGLWDRLSKRLITADDAIVSHTWVANNRSQAGIAFRNCPLETNPKKLSLSKVSIAFTFPQDTYTPVKGLVAMTKSCQAPEVAKQFIDFLVSPDGQKVIEQYGLDGVTGEKATASAKPE